MRDKLPDNTIICNGAGNFSGWWHRYWRYGPMPTQLAPTSGTMGYGLPASVAAALRFKDRPVVCVAGDGDFLMNGQELATAAQYAADLLVILVDNASYGTIRMHQEREYPERISATELKNPDFAALARAYGGWAQTIDKTEDFTPALDEALKRNGIRLLHCKTDVEQISNATTISKLQRKGEALVARFTGTACRVSPATPVRTAGRERLGRLACPVRNSCLPGALRDARGNASPARRNGRRSCLSQACVCAASMPPQQICRAHKQIRAKARNRSRNHYPK